MGRIGRSQLRFEDDRLLRGDGRFANDLAVSGDAILVFLRSPHAAATITEIDLGQARSVPGFIAVFGWRDMQMTGADHFVPRATFSGPDGGAMRIPPFTPLANGAVHYCGEPILGVLAEDIASAETICEQINITFDGHGAVTTVRQALSPDAPKVWDMLPDNRCFCLEKGDADKVATQMTHAAHVVEQQLTVSRVTAAAIEPRAMRALFETESKTYRLEIGTQTPNRIRPDLAKVLGVKANQIEVVACDCGGSFGMKNNAFPEYAVGLWAARQFGRTISWRASRLESFMADTHAREQIADVKLALDETGQFLALDVAITSNLGAFLGPATIHPVVGNIGGVVGVYNIPASHVRVDGVFSNTQSMAPYRGAGRPEATYIIERIIDIAAAELGFDKVELRRRNMIKPAQMPFQTGLVFTYDSGDFPAVLDRALAAADYDGYAKRRDNSMANGFLRGIGVANPIEIAGGPGKKPHSEFARVTVYPTGMATLVSGSSDSGQGHLTTLRQILHSQLGVAPEDIELVAGDTRSAPTGTGTFGSRTVAAAGTSVFRCAESLINRMLPDAAHLLDADRDQLSFEDGYYQLPGTNRSVSFLDVVKAQTAPICAEFDGSADDATFPNGCHVCEVEIDQATGLVKICSYLVVDDVGTVINPLLLEGQIAGGIAQGLGQALMEQVVYDPDSGQLLSASFTDYAMPRASDMPAFSVISQPTLTASNPLGAKGAGEAGTVGALAAVMNAVCDALASAGVEPIDMPATPCAVWSALNTKQRDIC